jgi:DNA-binding IscR family transcriptional regulator
MLLGNDFLLGNGALHDRFCLTTEILGALMAHGARPLSNAELEQVTGRSAREIGKICQSMRRVGLLAQATSLPRSWKLDCEPSKTTLEDVYRCVLAEQPRNCKAVATRSDPQDATFHHVNLLIMQATMAINQSVLRHLSQFSLDLLKGRAGGMLSLTPKARVFC